MITAMNFHVKNLEILISSFFYTAYNFHILRVTRSIRQWSQTGPTKSKTFGRHSDRPEAWLEDLLNEYF
jgi:hypothetical protein